MWRQIAPRCPQILSIHMNDQPQLKNTIQILLVIMVAVGAMILLPMLAYSEAPPIAPDAAISSEAAPVATAPVAPAAVALPAPDDIVGIVGKVVQSAKEGNWKLVTALLLTLAMAALNRVRGKVKFLSGDRGGAIAVMALGFLGAIATALAADMAFDLKLMWGAFSTSLLAAGGYNWFKRLVWPEDRGEKPPAWLEGDKTDETAPAPDMPATNPGDVA